MKSLHFLTALTSLCVLTACDLLGRAPTAAPPPTATTPPALPTVTTTPLSTAPPAGTSAATPTPHLTAEPKPQFIAYVKDGQLLVTDVTGGVRRGSTQYTLAGVDDQVTDIVWSPSGEFIAFTSLAQGQPRIFVVYAVGAGTPWEIGPGARPAWSPDGARLIFERDFNLWVTPFDSPAPQPFTSEANWAWGQTTFSADGRSLITASVSRDFMGASGNTEFRLEQLDPASGARTILPGMQTMEHGISGRLPDDLRFSPDGQRLAFSTSVHVSACAAEGAYYVADADGGNLRAFRVPGLEKLLDPQREIYHLAFGYAWSPESDAIAASGIVVDCTDFAGTRLGAQLAVLGMDGSERLIIPGEFASLSYDRAGQFIAAARTSDLSLQDQSVHIYSAQSGQLLLDFGPGSAPQFQP